VELLDHLRGGVTHPHPVIQPAAAEADQVRLDHVSDALEVVRGLNQPDELPGLRLRERDLAHASQIRDDRPVQRIHRVIASLERPQLFAGAAQDRRQNVTQHVGHEVTHAQQLEPGAVESERGTAQETVVQVARPHPAVSLGPVREQPSGQPHEPAAEGEEDQSVRHVEQGVGVRNLARRFGGKSRHAGQVRVHRRQAGSQPDQLVDEEYPDHHTHHLEHEVDDRRPLGIPGLPDRSEEGGGRCADVGTQQQGNRGVESHQTLAGQDDDDPDGGRGRLNHGGEQSPDGDAEEGIGHSRHGVQEGLPHAERPHRIAHDAHSQEHESEGHHGHPVVPQTLPPSTAEHDEEARRYQ